MAKFDLEARASKALGLAGTALLMTAVLVGCAGATGAGPTSGPAATSTTQSAAPDPLLSPGTESAPDAAPTARIVPTPGPSVPRVAPLQPPAFASRIVMSGMDIDLPVISGDLQPPPSYPLCDVAAYVTRFNQPYEAGITYISAHAQQGMFLPLLRASERNDGSELLGMTVDVYVADGRSFSYEVNRVVRHATDYSALNELDLSNSHLVLQTSEGPYGTLEKLQVFAELVGEGTVAVEDANPAAMPRDCEPDASNAPASPR